MNKLLTDEELQQLLKDAQANDEQIMVMVVAELLISRAMLNKAHEELRT